MSKTIAPVFRLGMYNRVRGPGFFWIIPVLESVGQPVKSGLRIISFDVPAVFSKESIPIDVELEVFFRFDPERTRRQIAAKLVCVPEYVLADIVKDYADDFLRRVVGNFIAEEICNWKATARIRRQLSSILADRLGSLGYVIDLDSGVLIKKIIPPKEFLEIVLEAKRRDLIGSIAEEAFKDFPETIPADGTVEADQVSDHTELKVIRQERMISLQQQLAIHRRNLSWLEEQAARHGMDVPTRLLNEMDWEREAIARIEAELEQLRGRA